MWKVWKNKNINIETLAKIVTHFFKEKNFKVHTIKEREGYQISILPRITHNITEEVKIHIQSHPNELRLGFEGGSRSRILVLLGNVLSLFGGGVFVKRGLQSLENLEKLEKEFWIYMENAFDEITRHVQRSDDVDL